MTRDSDRPESETGNGLARRRLSLHRILVPLSVLVAITGLAILVSPYVSQYLLVQRLDGLGAHVLHERAKPEWLRRWLSVELGPAVDPITIVVADRTNQDSAVTSEILKGIDGLDSIVGLDLDLNDQQLRELDFPLLRVLSLGPSATDDGLSHLRRFPELIAVNLTDSQVTDAGLAHLTQVPNLDWLNLYGCDALSDDDLQPLTGSTTLRYVEICDCPQLGDGALQALASCSRLRRLKIERCGAMTDEGLSQLRGSPVEVLIISDCPGIQGPGFHELRSCPSLVRVDVCGRTYDDEFAVHLGELDQVYGIYFLNTRVSEDTRRTLDEALPRGVVRFEL